MNRTKLWSVTAIVILVGSVVLAGACGGAPAENVIKIGAPNPLSGPAAGWGLPADRGLRMMVDDVNDAGGITVGGETYTFEVVSADTEGTVEGAIAAANKLVNQDQVQYAVGGIFKETTIALTSVFTPAGVLHFRQCWGYDCLCTNDTYTFRLGSSPQEYSPTLWTHLLDMPEYSNSTKWAFCAADSPGHHELTQQLEAPFEPLGLCKTAEEYFPFEQVEFHSVIEAIMETEPDGICYSGGTPVQVALLAKQFKEHGHDLPFLFPAPVSSDVFVDAVGVNYSEGIITVTVNEGGPWATPEMEAFRAAYVDEYGLWESNVVEVSSGFQILVEAMKEADSVQVADVIAVLEAGGPFDSVVGEQAIAGEELYGYNHQVFQDRVIWRVEDGAGVAISLMTWEEQIDLMIEYLDYIQTP